MLPLILLLALQPVVSPVLAHGSQGQTGDHHAPDPAGDGQYETAGGGLVGPQARALTPNARYVEQRNPAAWGSMVVWQEREVGRDWDIVAFNLSTGGPSFPVTLERVDQVDPVIRGPWVAWVEEGDNDLDIVVLNLRSGEQFQVPDSGGDEQHPVFGRDAIYWQVPAGHSTGLVRGYDLLDRKMIYPAENRTVVRPPAAFGPYVAWAEGSNLDAKVRVLDTRTDREHTVPDFWSVEDGPVLSTWGVAFVADVRGSQRGTYAVLYNWTEERLEPFRDGKYPHRNIGACGNGIIWDEFAGDDPPMDVVAIWDGYTGKIASFSADNYDGTCTGDWLLYEKEMPAEDEDLGTTARIYTLDLRATRAPSPGRILMTDGLERGIYKGDVTFTGVFRPGDPRESLEGLWVSVDGQGMQPAEARRVGDGYEWRVTVDTSNYFSGQHTLNVIAVDSRGTESRQGFTFFTNGEYRTDPSVFDRPLRIPVEGDRAFPYNVLAHYEDYQAFYNTLLFVLSILIAIAFAVRHWLAQRARGTPEYVPPAEDDPPPKGQDGAPQSGSSAVSFQRLS